MSESISYHIHMPLSAAYRMLNGTTADKRRLKLVLGYNSLRELRKDLDSMVMKGMHHIPGEGCEHDGTGNCPGHIKSKPSSKGEDNE